MLRTQKLVTFWIIVGGFYSSLIGFETQAGGFVLLIPQFRQDFGHNVDDSYTLEGSWQFVITGGPYGTNVLGSFAGSYLSDRIGRKYAILIGCICTIPFVICEVIATKIEVFFVGKFMNSFFLGVLQTSLASYLAEISPLALRGVSIALLNLCQALGGLVSAIIMYGVRNVDNRWTYRSMLVAQFFFSGVSIIFCLFMPESPYWLLSKGKNKVALKEIHRLYKSKKTAVGQYAVACLTILEANQANADSDSILECFKGTNLRRTLIAMLPMLMQSLSGVAYISNYSTYYYQLAGFSDTNSYQIAVGAQALSLARNMTSWFLLDRIGRRSLFLGIGSLFVLNLLTASLGLDTSNFRAVQASCGFMAMYNYFFNIAIGPVAYVIASEIPTSRLKAKTTAIAFFTNNAFNCIWAFALSYMFNEDQANMGSSINFIFAGCCFISLFVFYFYHPELGGKSFEDLDKCS